MAHPPQPLRRLHILVEGCLDKAVAEWLAQKAGLEAEAEIAGGWTSVIRQLVDLLPETRTTILGIIDADHEIGRRVKDAVNQLERRAQKRGISTQVVLMTPPGADYLRTVGEEIGIPVLQCPHIHVPVLLLRTTTAGHGEKKNSYLTFWCRNTPCHGTVEDVVQEMLNENYGYQPPEMIPPACGKCPNKYCGKDYAKYEPIVFLAACAKRGGTPVLIPAEHHCGIDVKKTLNQLNLAQTPIATAYIKTITTAASNHTTCPTTPD